MSVDFLPEFRLSVDFLREFCLSVDFLAKLRLIVDFLGAPGLKTLGLQLPQHLFDSLGELVLRIFGPFVPGTLARCQ